MKEQVSHRTQIISNKHWVLFDGSCGLCHWAVQFIVKRDLNKMFCFAPLASAVGQKLCEAHGLNTTEAFSDSVVLIPPNEAYYTRSEAALQILKQLPKWRALAFLMQFFPNFVLDLTYEWVAKNRIKWFGSKNHCSIQDFPKGICYKDQL